MSKLLAAVVVASLSMPLSASAPTERQMAAYRNLQANVDHAVLDGLLNRERGKVQPASGKIRYMGWKVAESTGQTFFFKCKFYTVRSDEVNAISSPGGNIFLFRGLGKLKLTDAETAAKTYGRGSAQLAMLTSTLQNLQYDRQQEYEADVYGAQFLLDAGYDPRAMLTGMQKLAAYNQSNAPQGRAPAYLQNHPLTADRVAALERLIPQLHARGKHLVQRNW